LRKFHLFTQNRNFSQILPRRAIFAQICDLAERNFLQNSQILQFAHICSAVLAQILLIIQRTRLYNGYRTVVLKQNREKLFVATTKHLHATFGQCFADFQRIFQFLRATCANSTQFVHNFSAFSAQFLHFFP